MVTYFAAGWRIDNTTSGSSPKFSRVEFRRLDQQKQVYITEFDYSHPQHTRLNTILLNQETGMSIPISTPTEVAQDPLKLLPRLPPSSFYVYNELLTHDLKSTTKGFLSRQGRHKYIYAAPFGTTRGRQELWTYWRANKIEGVFARDVDEHLLREEPVLRNYWKARDRGKKEEAQASLMEFKEILDVILVVSDNPTTRTNLHIKFSDLDALGTGGDGVRVGRQSVRQDNEILPVMNLDSGTWPTGGGGVGSCRRDLIDYLSRIRWTAFVEIGSAEAVQRDYQIERNISSITYLPLWDVDFSSPDENIYRNLDFRTLRKKKLATKDSLINSVFVPMVYQLINAIADDELDSNKLTEYEELFVDMYLYFQKCDWVKSWNHASTQQTWIATWIECSKKRYKKKDTILLEMPTLKEIDMLFSLLTRLLLPLSATLPKIPVVHVSHHADYVNPCTSIQNVDWEKWLGGGKYNDDKQKIDISRRIYPVVNGMNVARFKPKPELENNTPLAVMLSHVSPVKDIHNAIYAANVIVNQLHIQNYQLYIYGSKEKDAAYAAESENLISSLNLQGKVILKGLGSPSDVLPAGWIFVNSSITEGLPLALGEAGLCGLPVVCTDVGGSREVISDLSTGVVYGAIAPPAKARQLALGELRVLTMSDGLEQLIDPNAPVVRLDDLLAKGPEAVEKRMCKKDVREKRRKLGLQLRERTIQTFSIAKYWRQHEQVLWLGWLYAHKKSKSSFE
ncbi:UDP-Glycosyltransferase/glycogen phosphorylase [Anaeromyces robustus]|uniref:UDP-Glycosyltransferase/glycogen phosphorylase n=1 Tax=Anaeromyces robustus TaxID=1754192 RepID=A0A1Y1WK47_9FUNG|nr:UDP-Glycosyltransferase/glycogen phosphorylase [Anaeromyces robustus]|eukprot:ORX73474.1 UDP-Glycosyltransferase/glycogen phosphorylase [Anaeromyces robustus]